jgi:hypothetical protein
MQFKHEHVFQPLHWVRLKALSEEEDHGFWRAGLSVETKKYLIESSRLPSPGILGRDEHHRIYDFLVNAFGVATPYSHLGDEPENKDHSWAMTYSNRGIYIGFDSETDMIYFITGFDLQHAPGRLEDQAD